MGQTKQCSWTTPYYGVQHLESACQRYRVTVSAIGEMAQASMWVPGCRLSPETKLFGSVDQAKAFGESWMAQHTGR